MKNFVKIMAVVLALMMVASIVLACQKEENDAPITLDTTTAAETTTTVETTTAAVTTTASNTTDSQGTTAPITGSDTTTIKWGELTPLVTTKAGN